MYSWPRGAAEILARLDAIPRSRSDLLLLADVSPEDWSVAIGFLVETGRAIRTGVKRGTRYQAASAVSPAGPAVRIESRGYVQATVANAYHDIVDELLMELGSDSAQEAQNILREPGGAGCVSSLVEVDRTTILCEEGSDSGILEESAEDEVTEEVSGLVMFLRAKGAHRIIDQRNKGGCLWVIDGPGVSVAVHGAEEEFGVQFYFKRDGGRSTDGASAWWTKG